MSNENLKQPPALSEMDLYNACLSYQHDFGLFGEAGRKGLMHQAREWARAFGLAVQPSPPEAQTAGTDEKWAARAIELLAIPYPEDVPEVSGSFRANPTQPVWQPGSTEEQDPAARVCYSCAHEAAPDGQDPCASCVANSYNDFSRWVPRADSPSQQPAGPALAGIATVVPSSDLVTVPREWVQAVADLHCPNAFGFEGADTFPDCGDCVVCRAKAKVQEGQGTAQATEAAQALCPTPTASVTAVSGRTGLEQALAALKNPHPNPELRHALTLMAIESLQAVIDDCRHAVLFSVTIDGQHTGDIFPTQVQAEIAVRNPGRWYQKVKLAVVPLYAAPPDLLERVALLERDGPVMQRGTDAAGNPWVGTMREVLGDYKQAADVEAKEVRRLTERNADLERDREEWKNKAQEMHSEATTAYAKLHELEHSIAVARGKLDDKLNYQSGMSPFRKGGKEDTAYKQACGDCLAVARYVLLAAGSVSIEGSAT